MKRFPNRMTFVPRFFSKIIKIIFRISWQNDKFKIRILFNLPNQILIKILNK